VIRKFIAEIEKAVRSSPIVLFSDIRHYFDPLDKSVYLKGRLVFTDSSILDMAIFSIESHNRVTIDKYRIQYMSSTENLVFRYDNAAHHPETESFPHHKHLPEKVIQSTPPKLTDILNEISAFILKQ